MKDINLLVWLTQLGMTVVVPPVLIILLAVWLYNVQDWGQWVVWVGVIIGAYSAVEGLRVSLKAMERLSRDKKTDRHKSVSYNDHN